MNDHIISFRLGTAFSLFVFLTSLVMVALHVSHVFTGEWGLCVWAFNAGWSGERLLGGRS